MATNLPGLLRQAKLSNNSLLRLIQDNVELKSWVYEIFTTLNNYGIYDPLEIIFKYGEFSNIEVELTRERIISISTKLLDLFIKRANSSQLSEQLSNRDRKTILQCYSSLEVLSNLLYSNAFDNDVYMENQDKLYKGMKALKINLSMCIDKGSLNEKLAMILKIYCSGTKNIPNDEEVQKQIIECVHLIQDFKNMF